MIQVALFSKTSDENESGRIAFATLLVQSEKDYNCKPDGLLSMQEVREICAKLCQLPQINSGTVGRFRWKTV